MRCGFYLAGTLEQTRDDARDGGRVPGNLHGGPAQVASPASPATWSRGDGRAAPTYEVRARKGKYRRCRSLKTAKYENTYRTVFVLLVQFASPIAESMTCPARAAAFVSTDHGLARDGPLLTKEVVDVLRELRDALSQLRTSLVRLLEHTH